MSSEDGFKWEQASCCCSAVIIQPEMGVKGRLCDQINPAEFNQGFSALWNRQHALPSLSLFVLHYTKAVRESAA